MKFLQALFQKRRARALLLKEIELLAYENQKLKDLIDYLTHSQPIRKKGGSQ